MDEHGIICRKVRDGPNIFQAIMIAKTLQPYILYMCHNALGHNGSMRLYHFIRRKYFWKKVHQNCNKFVHSWTECQQVTLKEPQYISLKLKLAQDKNHPPSEILEKQISK